MSNARQKGAKSHLWFAARRDPSLSQGCLNWLCTWLMSLGLWPWPCHQSWPH